MLLSTTQPPADVGIRSTTQLHEKYGTPIFPLSQPKKKARPQTDTAGLWNAHFQFAENPLSGHARAVEFPHAPQISVWRTAHPNRTLLGGLMGPLLEADDEHHELEFLPLSGESFHSQPNGLRHDLALPLAPGTLQALRELNGSHSGIRGEINPLDQRQHELGCPGVYRQVLNALQANPVKLQRS